MNEAAFSLPDRLRTLAEIAEIPTAALHEEGVAAYVRRRLGALGLPVRRDRFGNLHTHYSRNGSGGGSGDGTDIAHLALVAHMDHPAFEVASVDGQGVTAALLGGIPGPCFRKRVPVRIFPSADGAAAGGPARRREVAGAVVGYEDSPTTRRITLKLEVADGAAGQIAPGDFGVFDLPSFRQEGDLVHLRAADDLVGCAAILLTLEEASRRGLTGSVYGVFTRAEEIGLVGATLLAEAGELPRNAIVVSLETSKELPGAEMGQGPVIRVGDRTRSFDPEAEAVLLAARTRLQAADRKALVQRQLMSGGTCEATAFGLHGYRATGVAIPLGNYHNVGPDQTIEAEYVDARDFSTEVDLLVAAAEVVGQPTGNQWPRFAEAAERYRGRLEASAERFGERPGEGDSV